MPLIKLNPLRAPQVAAKIETPTVIPTGTTAAIASTAGLNISAVKIASM